MEQKHTPGPWMVREFNSDIQISANNFREPAIVRRIMGTSSDCQTALRAEQVANARLIAAAPELLAALRAIDHAWTSDMPSGPQNPILVKKWRQLWEQARAALAELAGKP